MNKVTSYVVAGHILDDGREVSLSNKYTNGKRLGVKILTEKTFSKLIKKLSGKPFCLSLKEKEKEVKVEAKNKGKVKNNTKPKEDQEILFDQEGNEFKVKGPKLKGVRG